MSYQGPIVDAHHHFWDPEVNYHPWLRDQPPIPFRYGDYSSINRRYLQDEYLADAKRFNIAGSVYMETEWDPRDPIGEMKYVESLREGGRLPTVAVGQIWLHHADADEILDRLASFDFVRSVRQKPRANSSPKELAPGGMTDTNWRKGFAQLSKHRLRFDLQTPWWHLHEAASVAQDFPETQIILNHAGLPSDRSAEGIVAWCKAMANLAHCPNVSVKISGIGVPGKPWTPENNREIVLTIIDLFGVERCMFASNFPVDGLCGSFDDIFGGFDTLTANFSEAERLCLFHDNAVRIYAIPRDWLRPQGHRRGVQSALSSSESS